MENSGTTEVEPINKKRKKLKDLRQFILYTICAGVATLFDWGSFYLFARLFLWHHILSAMLSYTIGGGVNYTLNKIITFRDKTKKVAAQLGIYAVVMIIAYGLTALFMFLFVDVLRIEKFVARIITTGIVFIYNFIMHKNFTFNKKFRKKMFPH